MMRSKTIPLTWSVSPSTSYRNRLSPGSFKDEPNGNIHFEATTSESEQCQGPPPAAAPTSRRTMSSVTEKKIIFLLLVSSFTACWYYSSSKCAIATQHLVQEYRKLNDESTSSSSLSPLTIMTVLTALQLFAGLIISYALYLLLTHSNPDIRRHTKFFISTTNNNDAWTKADIAVGNLHFFGCLCTNMGFAFGSATVVQVIKLLEPIETLLLMALFHAMILKTPVSAFHKNRTKMTREVLSVLIILLGTSMLLVQKGGIGKHVNFHSVFYALCSGFFMASRNVVKKMTAATAVNTVEAHEEEDDDDPNKKEDHEMVMLGDNEKQKKNKSKSSTDMKQQVNVTNDSTSTNTNTNRNASWKQAAVNGIVNFAAITAVGSIPALICLMLAEMSHHHLSTSPSSTSSSSPSSIERSIVKWMILSVRRHGIESIYFHGMFNLASVSVLSLITAQSHSLLNVGKRICNVLYAAIVFHEPIGTNGMIGLFIAAMGGALYSNAGNTIPCDNVASASARLLSPPSPRPRKFQMFPPLTMLLRKGWSRRKHACLTVLICLTIFLWRSFAMLYNDVFLKSVGIGVGVASSRRTATEEDAMAAVVPPPPPSNNVMNSTATAGQEEGGRQDQINVVVPSSPHDANVIKPNTNSTTYSNSTSNHSATKAS